MFTPWKKSYDKPVCLVTQLCLTLCNPMDCSLPGSSGHGDSPIKNTGVGCHALFQGIFPTLGSNPGLQHCRQILYHLNHQGSSRILEWVAHPFSRGSFRPRDQTRVSQIAGGFFIGWATREVHIYREWLQYSCLENSMHRGAWRATVHGVAKSWTWLSD